MKLFTLLLLLALSGCAPVQYVCYVKYVSTYNQQTKVKIARAFILCTDGRLYRFLNDYAKAINMNLQQRDVQTQLLLVNELSFTTPQQIEQAIKDFNPDVVISLNRDATHMLTTRFGDVYNGGNYYFGVKKTGEDADYWKAMIYTSNEWCSAPRRL